MDTVLNENKLYTYKINDTTFQEEVLTRVISLKHENMNN